MHNERCTYLFIYKTKLHCITMRKLLGWKTKNKYCQFHEKKYNLFCIQFNDKMAINWYNFIGNFFHYFFMLSLKCRWWRDLVFFYALLIAVLEVVTFPASNKNVKMITRNSDIACFLFTFGSRNSGFLGKTHSVLCSYFIYCKKQKDTTQDAENS
jgi:hypothetical protein